MQILVDFITLQRDIHVYMKLFRLYTFPMLDIVIQRCTSKNIVMDFTYGQPCSAFFD